MESEEESKRGRSIKINVKKSHHIGTEPLLYVIHDRGLRYGDLRSKAKPRVAPKPHNSNSQTTKTKMVTHKHKVTQQVQKVKSKQNKKSIW